MKKGFTIFELILVFVITGILILVVVPTAADITCNINRPKCKTETPKLYRKVCLRNPANYPEKDVYTSCAADMENCLKNPVSFAIYSEYKKKMHEEKAVQNTECNTEVKHDTVYVFVKNAVIHVKDENTSNTTTCVEDCKKNYVSESLVKFCIRNNCK